MTTPTVKSLAMSLTAWLIACLVVPASADEGFSAKLLEGVRRVAVDVKGIHPDFVRYGLEAETLREKVAARLDAAGLPVVDAETALQSPGAGQLVVELVTNKDQYAFYFYAVSVKLNRKLPLTADGGSFAATEVWSKGQHGVLNPSDLKAVYGFVDKLVDQFLDAHGRDNAGRRDTAARFSG